MFAVRVSPVVIKETDNYKKFGEKLMECKPTGPTDAKLFFVAEAPGSSEEQQGKPLVGSSGQEFDRCLREAGIDRLTCRLDNVFHFRPPENKFHLNWCVTKKGAEKLYKVQRIGLVETCPEYPWPNTYTWAGVGQGKYLKPEYLPELQRLREELIRVKPNLVVTLGGVPTWALIGTAGITKLRGVVAESSLVPGLKVLPTWHPAYIQRVWESRLTLIVDLVKAKREMEFPEIRRPQRSVYINPSLDDIKAFRDKYIRSAPLLSFDTETARKQITCISFAPTVDRAIVIPFVDYTKPGYNYWKNPKDEAEAWRLVQELLNLPMPKLAQNGLYDLQYLWFVHGIVVKNYLEDTMLLHHALYIELKKDLGYLGSIYTDEAAWKLMRHRPKDSVEKKED